MRESIQHSMGTQIPNELLVPERKDWNEELLHYRKGEAVSKV